MHNGLNGLKLVRDSKRVPSFACCLLHTLYTKTLPPHAIGIETVILFAPETFPYSYISRKKILVYSPTEGIALFIVFNQTLEKSG